MAPFGVVTLEYPKTNECSKHLFVLGLPVSAPCGILRTDVRITSLEAFMAIATTGQPMRLTLRGKRLLRTVLVTAVLLTITPQILGQAGANSVGSNSNTKIAEWVTVNSGDTLWGIARSIAPGQDPREVVYEIKQLNEIAVSGISVGDRLRVPLY